MPLDDAIRTDIVSAFLVALGRAGERDDRVRWLVMRACALSYESKLMHRAIVLESDMHCVGVAAGLGMCGYIPFVIGSARKCFDVALWSIGRGWTNVRLVGSYVGVGIGPDGHSQMALEDTALMRTIPNMAVIQPGSGIEAEAAVDYLVRHVGPAYLRLTRQKVKEIYDASYTFEFGKGVKLREGSDIAIVASGAAVEQALGAADLLAEHGIAAAVANIHTIQPIDADLLAELASDCGRIVTVEDHVPVGGLAGAVCETLAERAPVPVRRIGVRGFGESGDPSELYDRFGLSAKRIAEATAGFIGSPAEVELARV